MYNHLYDIERLHAVVWIFIHTKLGKTLFTAPSGPQYEDESVHSDRSSVRSVRSRASSRASSQGSRVSRGSRGSRGSDRRGSHNQTPFPYTHTNVLLSQFVAHVQTFFISQFFSLVHALLTLNSVVVSAGIFCSGYRELLFFFWWFPFFTTHVVCCALSVNDIVFPHELEIQKALPKHTHIKWSLQ